MLRNRSSAMANREDLIRARAHELWEAAGRPEGRELDHWAQAEREVAEGGTEKPKRKRAAPAKADGAVKPAARKAPPKKAAAKK
jgi:hypothetical protein